MKTRAIDAKPDDYLSITQVVDENGSEQDIISTGFVDCRRASAKSSNH